MKEGKYQWTQATKPQVGGKPLFDPVANSKKILDLLKYRTAQFGLNYIMQVMTMGTGAVETQPRVYTIPDYWNDELDTHRNVLKNIHVLTIEHVHTFSGWFMGETLSTLTASADMTINAIDPNESGN